MVVQPAPDAVPPVPWINPIGGYGDMLMVGGVLRSLVELRPEARFNLVRRTSYVQIFAGHPAIATIGHPPPGCELIGTDYWAKETLGLGNQRPYQILARAFGLPTPAPERLYLHGADQDDALLGEFLPKNGPMLVIAPSSDSPRKGMPFEIWHRIVDFLLADGVFVVQVGRPRDVHVRNAFSLLGVTTPHQLIALLRRADAVITLDNFVMHAAYMTGVPTVVIWGATWHEIYGYPGQIHLQSSRPCGYAPGTECLYGRTSLHNESVYGTPCPEPRHCMTLVSPADVLEAARQCFGGGRRRSRADQGAVASA